MPSPRCTLILWPSNAPGNFYGVLKVIVFAPFLHTALSILFHFSFHHPTLVVFFFCTNVNSYNIYFSDMKVKDADQSVDDETSARDNRAFVHTHSLLKAIAKIVPM